MAARCVFVEHFMKEIDPEFPAWVRAGGKKREVAFDFVEEIYGNTLRSGEERVALYVDLLEKVRQAGPEAVRQYQQRFVPMLDPAFVKKLRINPVNDAGDQVQKNEQQEVDSWRNVSDEAVQKAPPEERGSGDRRSKGFFTRLFGG
jgi:hypothetical protein